MPHRFASRHLLIIASACALLPPIAHGQQREIAFAGFAYTGTASTRQERFPLSARYEASLLSTGQSATKRIAALIAASPPKGFAMVGGIDDLKGRDQAIVTALVVTNETSSVEQFGPIYKVLVLIRAQALFFDFKSQTVLRAYPFSFAYVDALNHAPSNDEVFENIQRVYEGAESKPGIFARYTSILANAALPSSVPRFLQITEAVISPEVLEQLPAAFKANTTSAQTWLADLVSEAISSRAAVPILPYAQGYAVNNVMALSVSDGDVYNLTLPKPDYAISVDLSKLKKVKYGESAAGSSFIYGSFATVKIVQPLAARSYLNAPLKNGEVKLVPASQSYVDDFPAYYDSINGLFSKLADSFVGKGAGWVKSASTASDIEQQISQTKELMQLCK